MGRYRDIIYKNIHEEDEKPTDDWVYITDVYDLLNTIETDFNDKMKSIVKDIKNLADDVESELDDISTDLY